MDSPLNVSEQFLIFLLGAATMHGLYLAILLWIKAKGDRSKRLLAICLLCTSLHLLNYLFFLAGFIRDFPHLLSVLSPAIYLLGPCFYFFVKSTLRPTFKWKAIHLIHLLPFIHHLWQSIAVSQLSAVQKLKLIERLLHPEGFQYIWLDFLKGTYVTYLLLCYAIAAWRLNLKAPKPSMNGNTTKLYRWLTNFCLGFVVLICLDISVKIIGFATQLTAFSMEYLLAALTAISIHLAGYFTLGIISFPTFTHKKYKSSSLDQHQIYQYQQQLLQILEKDRPWLDPDLKISDLARLMGIPSHQLSQIISEGMQRNFFDLINQYRIEEIKLRLIDPSYSHYSILAIAMDCGFNNKASFNRVFKKLTGMTPTAFMKAKQA